VIDTKRYQGRFAVHRPLFGAAKLTINGRDKSGLIDGLDKQVGIVRAVVQGLALEVEVQGALCIVDADLPLFGGLSFGGYPLLYRKALAKRLNTKGPLSADECRLLAESMASRFPRP
jgi:hypothetical protein